MSFQDLKKAWLQEQFSPDILPFEEELVNVHLAHINGMEDRLDSPCKTPEEKAMQNLYEMELERIKYVLRCYLKRRLVKLERHFMHVIAGRLDNKLSLAEQRYVHAYADLVGLHMNATFLGQLPVAMQDMDEKHMMERPRLDQHVFVRVLDTVGDFQLDDQGIDTAVFEKDDTYVVRYKSIQALLKQKRVELI